MRLVNSVAIGGKRVKINMTFQAWLLLINNNTGQVTSHLIENTNIGVVEKHIRLAEQQLPDGPFHMHVIRFYADRK